MWLGISSLRTFFILALISEIFGSPLAAPPPVNQANKGLSGTHPSTKPSSGTPNVLHTHAGSPPGPTATSVPKLPSVSDCKAQLKMGDDTSLFYSGPGSYAGKAKKWRNADKSRSSYKILGEKWVDPKWQDKWQNDETVSKEFFNICSQAMAEASSGTVYVMLPSDTKGTDWHKGTVWDKFEWPNLGSGVTKVIRVNPDNDNSETIKGAPKAAATYRTISSSTPSRSAGKPLRTARASSPI